MPRSKPEYYLSLNSKDKEKKRYSNVGVAWRNEYGFAIQLNPGVVLDWRLMDEFYLNLIPVEKVRDRPEPTRPVQGELIHKGGGYGDFGDDDIPFDRRHLEVMA